MYEPMKNKNFVNAKKSFVTSMSVTNLRKEKKVNCPCMV